MMRRIRLVLLSIVLMALTAVTSAGAEGDTIAIELPGSKGPPGPVLYYRIVPKDYVLPFITRDKGSPYKSYLHEEGSVELKADEVLYLTRDENTSAISNLEWLDKIPPDRLRGLTLLTHLVSAEGMKRLKRHQELRFLSVHGMDFEMDEVIDNCPLLDTLALGVGEAQNVVSETFSDTTLDKISSLKHLRRFGISDQNVTDAGLAKVAALPKLEALALHVAWRTAITDKGLAELAKAPALQLVALEFTLNTRGDATRPAISLEGLLSLAKAPKLKHVILLGYEALDELDGEEKKKLVDALPDGLVEIKKRGEQ
jgi:hypothetical protein